MSKISVCSLPNHKCSKSVCVHQYDLPDDIIFEGIIAIDTEAMGLNNDRDRLCVVQIGDEKGNCHVVHFPDDSNYDDAVNLKKMLVDENIMKIFHFARFDIAIMYKYLNVMTKNIYCTKIASKLARTYTCNHGLKDLCSEFLGMKISKLQQSSDWGRKELTELQVEYAIGDVLFLHKLKDNLDHILEREGRIDLLKKCLEFVEHRAILDLRGWSDVDIFSHYPPNVK